MQEHMKLKAATLLELRPLRWALQEDGWVADGSPVQVGGDDMSYWEQAFTREVM